MHQRGKPEASRLAGQRFRKQLADELGAGGEVAAAAVQSLYRCVVDGAAGPAREAFARWKSLVAGACGQVPEKPSATSSLRRLAECYRLPPGEVSPAELLFSVHTYYAVLVRLVVWQWMAVFDKRPPPAEQFDRAQRAGRLRKRVEAFESGRPAGRSTIAAMFQGDVFSWYTTVWSKPLARLLRYAADSLADWLPDTLTNAAAGRDDPLTDLYQAVFPKPVRHALGEYYTPGWLAEWLLDEVGYQGDPDTRLVDPACGSGRFLAAAIGRVRRWQSERPGDPLLVDRELCRRILHNVVGFDLHPLAVLTARANYLIALGELARHLGDMEIPVRMLDSILQPGGGEARPDGAFDFVVGNPPWIAWDHLPPEYRQATKPLWQRYGLFSLSAADARHGGGKKDLSMLMLYRTADRDLKDGGRLGMVITQTLFQTKGAGDGFRRFRLGPDGTPLRVLRVNDLVKIRPFSGAANWTSTIILEKGSPTVYPVPYVKWTPSPEDVRRDPVYPVGGPPTPPGPHEYGHYARPPQAGRREYRAEPIDPDRPGSPWFLRPPGVFGNTPLARLTGPSDYRAHLGANSGGANGVYWVELLGPSSSSGGGVLIRNVAAQGKHPIAPVRQTVEVELVYPLLRWTDVGRFRAVPSAHLLLVQDPVTRKGMDEAALRSRCPRTLAYLEQFRGLLAGRAAYRRYQGRAAFYSMYNVGPYTLAPIKVVWRRMDRRINAAVVEMVDDPLLGLRPAVPQETCVLVAVDTTDEAHYLASLLNSAIVNFLVSSHSVRSGKGFGTPGMLDYLRLGRFDPASAQHAALASAGRQAHQAAKRGEDLAPIQRQIDRLAAALWDLGESQQEAIRREIEDC